MGEQNKYELTAESIRLYKKRTLYRIRALKDFANVKAGEVGGFVETEKNLDQCRMSWITHYVNYPRLKSRACIKNSARH